MIKRAFIFICSLKAAMALFIIIGAIIAIPAAMAQNGIGGDGVSTFEEESGELSQKSIRMELIQEFKTKQGQLQKREEELNRREDQLKSVEVDIEKKIQELRRLEVKLEDLIKRRKDVEDKSITALSKTYAAMAPEEAAVRIKAMNRAIALKLLAQMKSKKTAKILSNLDPATATEMTEQLVKRPFE